jgi:hypothetical protein
LSATPTPTPTLVLDRVLALLRPLVRLLLRHGVTYPVFAAALKRVFLAAAQDELSARGMQGTDSAVSLLSGVHRRDVRTLTRGALAEPASAPPPALGLAAQVVARWMHEPAFRGADGRPRALPRQGPQGFDALVASLSQDVRPRAVLDELLRLGVVAEQPVAAAGDPAEPGASAELALVAGGFAPRQGFEETLWLTAQNLHDHAAAAVANLHGESPQPGGFLEQAVFVDELGPESVQRLRQASSQAWQAAFQTVMQQAQERFDHDAATLPAPARRHRARFGVYFFSEQEPE